MEAKEVCVVFSQAAVAVAAVIADAAVKSAAIAAKTDLKTAVKDTTIRDAPALGRLLHNKQNDPNTAPIRIIGSVFGFIFFL